MATVADPQPGTVLLAPGMVSLDWLTLNMRAPDDAPIYGFPWQRAEPVAWDDTTDEDSDTWARYITEPTNIRTAQFAHVTYLNDTLGAKVATVWHTPHDGALHDPRWIQVQFANATLYTLEWVRIFRMFRAMGCDYTSISRVDIACDGIEGDGGDWPKVLQMDRTGAARYYGKCGWITRNERQHIIGGEFGSRASNKYIRAYRKKREMKSKGVKPHIVEAWCRAFGFDAWSDPAVEVNRFEVALKGKEIRRYFPNENTPQFVDDLAFTVKRADVFASMAPGMFDFRTPADRARDAVPVCRWDWSRLKREPEIKERAPRNLALSAHTIKTSLRAMFHVATVTGDASGLEACERLAHSAGQTFVEWYERKRYKWLRDFARIASARDAFTNRTLDNMRYGTVD